MKKGRICGFLTAALTVLYAIYIISYFSDIAMETFSGFIASSIVTPHMICVSLAGIFSLVGLFAYKRWAMLTAAILLSVSAAIFPAYAMFVIVQAIMGFIAYARMTKQ